MAGYSRLFRSRWAALFWAMGICWTAYEVSSLAGGDSGEANAAAPTDATGAGYNDADVAALKGALQNM
ncbi:MAG: hypothetical protein JO013_00275 [Alphaproteobacteria bacterium]|nr:hypothetical protein [Alphaproteobacteria bacterium]